MGIGSVVSVLCSSQSDANNTPTPRTPNIANTAKPLNIRRASRVLDIVGETVIGTSAARDSEGPQWKVLYIIKYLRLIVKKPAQVRS